jgi:hypothetical protein
VINSDYQDPVLVCFLQPGKEENDYSVLQVEELRKNKTRKEREHRTAEWWQPSYSPVMERGGDGTPCLKASVGEFRQRKEFRGTGSDKTLVRGSTLFLPRCRLCADSDVTVSGIMPLGYGLIYERHVTDHPTKN